MRQLVVNLNARGEIMADTRTRTVVMPLDHRMFAHNPGGFYAEQCLGAGYVPTALYAWPAAAADAMARAARESSGPMVTTEEIAERLAKPSSVESDCPRVDYAVLWDVLHGRKED